MRQLNLFPSTPAFPNGVWSFLDPSEEQLIYTVRDAPASPLFFYTFAQSSRCFFQFYRGGSGKEAFVCGFCKPRD